jgi:hypothetical protein
MTAPPRDTSQVKIDAHVHIAGGKRLPVAVMRKAGVRHVVNINYASDGDCASTAAYQQRLDEADGEYASTFLSCTTFSLKNFESPGFASETIALLDRRFRDHATIGVKIWKNLGMTLRDRHGRRVSCDDERFSPIFAWLCDRSAIVYVHSADPVAAWEPLNESSPHFKYFKRHHQYYFHGKPDAPSHHELLLERDRLISRWPGLRFVAAHLASLSHDVDLVAEFLDANPNAAVDTAARHADLMSQPDGKVSGFLSKYADRVLYGSDWSIDTEAGDAEDCNVIRGHAMRLQYDFEYFEQRLALPESVLRKLYFDSAWNWLRLADRVSNDPVEAKPR